MRAPATRPATTSGGSDASGIVYATGAEVTQVAVGDEVIIHHGWWDRDDPWVRSGRDPMIAPSAKIWGYETNHGSFGQFTVAQAHQCLPKPPHLSWEEAAAATLVGTTAYRMLFGWEGNTVREGDVVLVWGGAGGLGTQAIQLVRHAGGIPVAVSSDEEKGALCVSLGAAGWIDRREFDHWGIPPHWTDEAGQKQWTASARAFGKRIWDIVGERRNPAIVFEHPGESTIPTSVFVCDGGGMVVICAGTTGYSALVDLRYHWVRQKRLQGSHGTNDEQARAWGSLLLRRRDRPRARARPALRGDRPRASGHGRRRARERQHRDPRGRPHARRGPPRLSGEGAGGAAPRPRSGGRARDRGLRGCADARRRALVHDWTRRRTVRRRAGHWRGTAGPLRR